MLTLLSDSALPADARPACEGQWLLFEATDQSSHDDAQALCRSCPVLARCAALVATVEAPVGTWAGRLYGGNGRSSINAEVEDTMFTEDEAREASNAWQRGERTELNKIGRRVYHRRLTASREERRKDDGTLRTQTEQRYAEEDAMFTDEEARRGATAYRYGDKSEHNALAQRVHKRRQRQARLEAERSEGAA